MTQPKFSVIIPVYNQAEFLSETIQSVLRQTYDNYEVIIVNDASPDHSEQIVNQFSDPRINYLLHSKNLGLPAARNTGIRASTGDFIALLDADDIFHRDKLFAHATFLENHPEIGVSYNARFNFTRSPSIIREIWRPPNRVTLEDFVLGFPFSPSDMVIRRQHVFDVGLFDESHRHGAEDVDFPCRLALAGCQFASVDRALNYRRYHSGRIKRNLAGRIDDYTRALEEIFADPRCPVKVISLRNIALVNRYLEVVFYAFAQDETSFGQDILNKVQKINPDVFDGFPCRLVNEILHSSIIDENQNHETLLLNILNQLPACIPDLTEQFEWATRVGYLIRGLNAVMWNRYEDGEAHFTRARELEAKIDTSYIDKVAYELLNFEQEFGENSSEVILSKLTTNLRMIDRGKSIDRLTSKLLINKAFANYQKGNYGKVPKMVLQAIVHDRKYILNRGILSILIKSTIHRTQKPTKPGIIT